MSTAAQYFLRQGRSIIALATASGGPIAVLRLSGRDLSIYIEQFSKPPTPGQVTYTKVAGLDRAVVLYFKAPHSFTGEDVIEIQCHGVKALTDALLGVFQEAGALLALPGEFSFRAVMNEKMTLAEAEALNTALSDSSLSLEWAKKLVGLSKLGEAAAAERTATAIKKIVMARGRVEAAIDYPEAEAEQSAEVGAARTLVGEALASVEALLSSYENFSRSKAGLRIVILGSPNVGKSTLLNLLAGGERALVSEEAGTTRDFVDAQMRLSSGVKVTAIDTAGIRSGAEVGKVERAGIARAMDLALEADAVIWVRKWGASEPEPDLSSLKVPVLEVYSHGDKPSVGAFDFVSEPQAVLSHVEKWLSHQAKAPPPRSQNSEYWVSARQATLMESASKSLREADAALREDLPIELCGQFLLEAEGHLRGSLGERATDEHIGAIFAQFCLGK